MFWTKDGCCDAVFMVNALATFRMIFILVVMDAMGVHVARSTRDMQLHIAAWQPKGISSSDDKHAHVMLFQTSYALEQQNYNGLKIMGFDLTATNFVRMMYFLGLVLIYSVKYRIDNDL